MLREIGSNFWENPIRKKECPEKRLWWQNKAYSARYLKTGRNAIKACCRILGPGKRVLLPAYTCESVIQPFRDEGWDVRYYAIRPDLSIDEESVRKEVERLKPDMFLFHSFFGFDTVKSSYGLLKELSSQGILLLEDLTQGLMSDIHTDFADYYISSLRKFFAMPEGGIFISRSENDIPDIRPADDRIVAKAAVTWRHKAVYMLGGEATLKETFRKEYCELEEYIEENASLQEMTEKAVKMFNNVDFEEIGSKRRDNFNRIAEGVADIPWIKPICHKAVWDEIPLYFPLYLHTERTRLQHFLKEYNIYCPIIWQKPDMLTETDSDTEYMYRQMICIPIDQRYGEEEMNYIIKKLHEYSLT